MKTSGKLQNILDIYWWTLLYSGEAGDMEALQVMQKEGKRNIYKNIDGFEEIVVSFELKPGNSTEEGVVHFKIRLTGILVEECGLGVDWTQVCRLAVKRFTRILPVGQGNSKSYSI